MLLGFPDGLVVKNLPASVGDTGSNPDPGRCPPRHGAAKLMHHDSWATATEARVPLEPILCNKWSSCNEKLFHCE